jgi:hypothetical protein
VWFGFRLARFVLFLVNGYSKEEEKKMITIIDARTDGNQNRL